MQNMRPCVDEFPAEILPLLQSCWAEDPKLRPEFTEITQTLTKLLHKTETEDHHRITKEEKYPIPRSQALSPDDQSVKDNYKKEHETDQNQNEYTESKPKRIQKKRKRFLPCLFRCFGIPDMHASSMVVGQ